MEKAQRPPSPFKPDAGVYEPDSLKKARNLGKTFVLTDQQARAREERNKRSSGDVQRKN